MNNGPAGPDARHAQALHDIERELTVLLHRARRTTAKNAQHVHPELQPASYAVLLHVVDHGPTRASDIVEHLALDKGAVSRHLAQLEQLGLVERTSDPDDRRARNAPVSQLHADLGGIGDHVEIGDEIAVRIENHR